MKELEKLVKKYQQVTSNSINFEKFNNYAIVHHSTGIEGSTLTKEETFLLLDEKLTPKGKDIEYCIMALDHLEALNFTLNRAKKHQKLSIEDIKKIGSLIMKRTGSEISSLGGNFDSSKGDFRKATVTAGTTTFMDYKKVPNEMELLTKDINDNLDKLNKNSISDIYELSFKAHYQFVTIHPFADGNGRASRLIMNYIQAYFNLPLTIIFKEDKIDYFNALQNTRQKEDIREFLTFMKKQSIKFFKQEIEKLTKVPKNKRHGGFSYIF